MTETGAKLAVEDGAADLEQEMDHAHERNGVLT
jgi:hypothetical protein